MRLRYTIRKIVAGTIADAIAHQAQEFLQGAEHIDLRQAMVGEKMYELQGLKPSNQQRK